MGHRSGLPRTGLSRRSWTARALLMTGALLLHAAPAAAQDRGSHAADARTQSAVELAAGACRLERWAAAVDLMHVVERQARRAEDWLCLARAQLHTGQWVAALDSYDELAESEALVAPERKPAKVRLNKLAQARTALATDQISREVEARQLGAVERRELEERLAWIQIVPSGSLPVSVKLSLDGEPIARSRIGVAFPVQPGPHAFAVEVRGVVHEFEHWRVAQGERRRVNLSLPADPPARQAVAPLVAAQGQPHPQFPARPVQPPSELARWARGTLYAGGIASGAGLVLLATSNVDGHHEGSLRAGMAGLALGGMALLTAAGLYLAEQIVGSNAEEVAPDSSRRWPLQPWVSTNGAGLSGSF